MVVQTNRFPLYLLDFFKHPKVHLILQRVLQFSLENNVPHVMNESQFFTHFFARRDKKSLTEYSFLWDVMLENINGTNTKEKPAFSDESTGQVQTLKQLALKAVDNSALISRVNRKLTSDCSSEIDTSRDSTLTNSVHSLLSKNSSLFNALMHMDNVVITITDEAKQLIKAASNTERSVAVSGPMPVQILASIDTDSDESVDKDAFMTELMATHVEDSGLCHNRIGFSKSFLLDSTCSFTVSMFRHS